MPKNISRVVADRRSPLSRILNEWTRTTVHVAKAWTDIDVPWWYNERASLSVLAGAIWRCGGIAFEEFSAEKVSIGQQSSLRTSYSGRCDMFFELGTHGFNVEAKFGESGATNTGSKPVSRIERLMQEARKAAERLPSNEHRRLAIAFIFPSHTRKFVGNESAMIERWIQKTSAVRCTAKAWIFPAASRKFESNDGYYCPGAAVFIDDIDEAKHISRKR